MQSKKFCCDDMGSNVENGVLNYSAAFDEYGIPVPEDDISYILIKHCPWCGERLPTSKRKEWFRELELLGYDAPLHDDSIPEAFKSSEWRE